MNPSREDLINDIRSLSISPWSTCDPDDIDLTKVTGGLTNKLYKATIRGAQATSPDLNGATRENALLIRVFGRSDGLLNRPLENETYSMLSDAGISPKFIGEFPWGRIEEFLTDHAPLTSGLDMIKMPPDVDNLGLIAEAIWKVHSVDLGADPDCHRAHIYEVLENWLKVASKYGNTIRGYESRPDWKGPKLDTLDEEVRFVVRTCLNELQEHPRLKSTSSYDSLLRTVLCHNDLLSGNLMLHWKDRTIRLIDFEYSGYNNAICDLANIMAAVCESIMLSGKPQDVEHNSPPDNVKLYLLERYLGHRIPEEDEEAVLTLLAGFVMADELRWTIWGIIQSEQSSVEGFDYVHYYNSRFNSYIAYKRMFLERLAKLSTS